MKNLLSPKKKIRQINFLVISLVNILLSRNFCQKGGRIILGNFHTVISYISIILTRWLFSRNSPQETDCVSVAISRKRFIFSANCKSRHFLWKQSCHSVTKQDIFSLKKIRQINSFVISLVLVDSNVTFTKFLPKKRVRVFYNFHTTVSRNEKFTLTKKIVKLTL